MPPPKFSRLVSSEDYKLDNLSQEPLRYSNNFNEPALPAEAPTRWKSIKAAYEPQFTYVRAPIDDEFKASRPKTGKRNSSRLSIIANPVSNFRIPEFAAPWQHERPDLLNASKSTVRYFDRRKQWRRTFLNGLIQWFLTLSIALLQWATLFGFSRPHTLSRFEKYSFNALITLLSLALGLAVVAALKSYAKLLSWRFLASKYRDLQDFELVMNCDSQAKVLKLLWAGRTHGRFWLNKTQLLCIVSLFIFVALQITIGLLGLTYSIDNSSEPSHMFGNVSIVDLTNIYQDPTYNTSDFADQTAAANYFGLVGQNYYQYFEPLGQGDEGFESIYTVDGHTFFYNFVDLNPKVNQQDIVSATSKRWVQTDANCVELKIVDGGYVDYDSSTTTLTYKDERDVEHSIYVEGLTTFTTTVMSNGSSDCGARCTNLLLLDSAGFINSTTADEDPLPHLFGCNSTVSEVHNANTCLDERNCTLVDPLAKILAGAMGWSGTWYSENPLQYQTYPPGSPYSWDGAEDSVYQDATIRGSQVSWFTAGALAAMDDAGPRITVEGDTPRPGVALDVKWQFAIPVLCVVPAVQFFVLLIVCTWANGALIKDGSYLAAARLLRPVVEKLEEHGCALTGGKLSLC